MASGGASAGAGAAAASSAPPHQQPDEVHWALQPALADGETEDEDEEGDDEEEEGPTLRGHYSEAELVALMEAVSAGGSGEPCTRGIYDRTDTAMRRRALAYWGGVAEAMALRGFRPRSPLSLCRHWRERRTALAAVAAGGPAASASAVGGRKRSAGAAFAAAPPPPPQQQQLTAVEQQRAAFAALCVAYYQLGRFTREEFEAERAALLAWR